MKKKVKTVPAIFPMPVILIATYNEDGTIDVMNAAWGCAYDMNQIQLNISESHKTTENIRRTGVLTVTVATASHVAEADFVGMISAYKDKEKFAKTGLKAHKSDLIDAPILDDFPICMECKVDVEKLNIIAFDPFNGDYYEVGKKIAKAYNAGRKYIK